MGIFGEYLQALIFALIFAILIRSFVAEPFQIPSESMMPTLLVGDHIFVKRYAYGLRIPFTKSWLTEFDQLKRGDVVVFTEPLKEKDDFIKRVVGLPGDRVAMKNGQIYINGEASVYKSFQTGSRYVDNSCLVDTDPQEAQLENFPYFKGHENYQKYLEILPGTTEPHVIQYYNEMRSADFEFVVPAHHFFAMGDNRDNSADSRFIGPIPRENLKGKAEMIWLSMNSEGTVCPYDSLYDWFGPIVDGVFGVLGYLPFDGLENAPSVRWNRFGRDL